MSKKYKVKDVVNTTNEFGARTFAIISVTEAGYVAVELNSRKRYNLTDGQIADKVEKLPDNSQLVFEYIPQKGEDFCLQQAREFPLESSKWLALSKLKPGDRFKLVHRRTIFQNAEFHSVNFTKPIFPIRAKIKGRIYDFKLAAMIFED